MFKKDLTISGQERGKGALHVGSKAGFRFLSRGWSHLEGKWTFPPLANWWDSLPHPKNINAHSPPHLTFGGLTGRFDFVNIFLLRNVCCSMLRSVVMQGLGGEGVK